MIQREAKQRLLGGVELLKTKNDRFHFSFVVLGAPDAQNLQHFHRTVIIYLL